MKLPTDFILIEFRFVEEIAKFFRKWFRKKRRKEKEVR